MSDRELPARPNLEQYKKQAKDLARDCRAGDSAALDRARRSHPRFAELTAIALTDAQLILAREHGFESWPRFAAHITTVNLERSVAEITDPVSAFICAATVPREAHASGTVEEAGLILARYPQVARASIYTAAILADEPGVRQFLSRDPKAAIAKGGPFEWDALTYLCFSRYLRLDKTRSDAFVRTARALLEAGAGANTGWYEMIDHPNPRPVLESAIYGAAGIAHHAGLTRLLLEHGADPNDEETAYHAAEEYDLGAMIVLLDSGKLNQDGLTTLLIRKADWHDTEGIRILLERGADPNRMTIWHHTPLQHAMRRDNRLVNIAMMLDAGGDPSRKGPGGRSATAIAARRGRGDVLRLLAERAIEWELEGVDQLIAACAVADRAAIGALIRQAPQLAGELLAEGGQLLAEFAGNGNTEGVRCLLDLGVNVGTLFHAGDGYWDLAPNSTALHSAAWRMWPETVNLLIERGAPVNARDARSRTALMLAVKACVDSYWQNRRSPEPVQALLNAGSTVDGIELPSGYDAVDELLLRARAAGEQRNR